MEPRGTPLENIMMKQQRTASCHQRWIVVCVLAVCLDVGCSSQGASVAGGHVFGGNSATGGQSVTTAASGGGTQSTQSTATTFGGSISTLGGASSTGGVVAGLGGNGLGGIGLAGIGLAGNGAGGDASGNATGGVSSSSGGRSSGGSAAGGVGTGGSAKGGTAVGGGATGGAPPVAPGLMKDAEGQMALSGLTVVSYGGYLNGESFQQEGIISHNGYQYTAFWNTNKHVVVARRALPSGAWAKFEFTDYTLAAEDAHNTISIGIAPGDGTLHLAFDHHGNNLHYRKSNSDILTSPATANWDAASFSGVTGSLVGSTPVTLVTYPRFVIEPGGKKMLFSARIGESGSGDEYLWEYDTSSHTWVSIGKYLDGTSNASATVNAYLHGLSYTRGGTRLHASWCWRETPDATTNHDLLYVYSDDHGRTWNDTTGAKVATSGATFVTTSTASAKVWAINQNRGLINQEHMAVDSVGRVHVLLGHMPDALADDANFVSARTKSQYYHYWRNPTNGIWSRTSIASLPVVLNFRGKLAISSNNNVYAILPALRIAAAGAANNFATWTLLDSTDPGRFFSDPLIDSVRLETEDKLTIFYPQASSVNIWTLDYTVK